ncbi:MAG: hypothetical protein ACI88A_003405 [Paraglaciecola sp.]
MNEQIEVTESSSLLAKAALKQALQLDPKNRGLITDYKHIRYQHGFGAQKISAQFDCLFLHWMPFMSGFGGIILALLGQDNSYYYISDSH